LKLLLDTHALLWWLAADKQLSDKAAKAIAEPQNIVFVSAASIWEVRIKESLRKIKLPAKLLETIALEKFELLSISAQHADVVSALPKIHKDPFDRMLIAQSKVEGLLFVTADSTLQSYGINTLW
jgi:PIN domain nuclease of toxin-antitoxin system